MFRFLGKITICKVPTNTLQSMLENTAMLVYFIYWFWCHTMSPLINEIQIHIFRS